jgi:hypothetical protein
MSAGPTARRPAARSGARLLAGLLAALALLGAWNGAHARAPGHVLGEEPIPGSGWLGVWLQEIEGSGASTAAPAEPGVRIAGVTPMSPADRAGLRPGDDVTQFEHVALAGPARLLTILGAHQPGEVVRLTVQRGDRTLLVSIQLGVATGPLLAALPVIGAGDAEPPSVERRPYMGVQVIGLSEALAPYFKSKPREGVLVTHVEPNGPAERCGLLAGDVIRSLTSRKVRSPADLRQALTDFGAGKHELRIVRRGKRRTLRLRLEEPVTGAALPDVGIFASRRDLELLRDGLARGDPEAWRELARLRGETEALRTTLRTLERAAGEDAVDRR